MGCLSGPVPPKTKNPKPQKKQKQNNKPDRFLIKNGTGPDIGNRICFWTGPSQPGPDHPCVMVSAARHCRDSELVRVDIMAFRAISVSGKVYWVFGVSQSQCHGFGVNRFLGYSTRVSQ